MEKNDLTYRINGCAMTVHRKLGLDSENMYIAAH